MTKPFRFGVNMVTPAAGDEWRKRCRRAEELGYDVILLPDHLGMPAPFPAVVAAAEATERPRVGTFVLNAAFWNPAILAREIATTDALTHGRLEVGLGAGYVQAEHEKAGVEWRSPGGRIDHLQRTVDELDRLLGDEEHLPQGIQRPRPPLLLGGNGNRMLRMAAERAQIVAFSGVREVPGDPDGQLRVLSAVELDGRVADYRRFADGRQAPAELNLLVHFVAVTTDRPAAVQGLMQKVPYLNEEQVLELPSLLVGTVEQITGQLRAQRERFGISYIVVLDPYLEALAPVIEELSGT